MGSGPSRVPLLYDLLTRRGSDARVRRGGVDREASCLADVPGGRSHRSLVLTCRNRPAPSGGIPVGKILHVK